MSAHSVPIVKEKEMDDGKGPVLVPSPHPLPIHIRRDPKTKTFRIHCPEGLVVQDPPREVILFADCDCEVRFKNPLVFTCQDVQLTPGSPKKSTASKSKSIQFTGLTVDGSEVVLESKTGQTTVDDSAVVLCNYKGGPVIIIPPSTN